MNLAFALRQALRGTGCRPFGSDMKVIANDTVRYPDISVTCHPVDDRDHSISDPVLIIEVVSPSTEREDRGRKKFDYFATASIRQYAIIEQDARRIDLYTRTGASWIDEVVEGNAVLSLSSIGVEVSLDMIYEDTELDATRPREGERQAQAGRRAGRGAATAPPGAPRRSAAISIRAAMTTGPSPASASTSPTGRRSANGHRCAGRPRARPIGPGQRRSSRSRSPARARNRTCQCARPVGTVKTDGTVRNPLRPAPARDRDAESAVRSTRSCRAAPTAAARAPPRRPG